MQAMPCRSVRPGEIPRAVSVQVAAFVADPIMRWMWPEAHAYIANLERLVHGFGGGAFQNDGADVCEGFVGGALWLPPGVSPEEESLGELMEDTLPAPKRAQVEAMLEEMGASHPDERHWHLAFIGVDAAHQGKGAGGDLMRYRLAQIDAEGAYAYLESSNPRNVHFYQRHGFEVVREIRIEGAPPVTPMVRPPR